VAPEPKATKAENARAARAQKAEKPEKSDGKKGAKGGKNINPIDDPNGYIKANFQEMSNRELARFTGLSEHTIRRKLGEWGLKRKQG
jgi:DNA invertase Pin-like site-specific DNA recombinase